MDPVEQPNKVPTTVITLTARPDICLHLAGGSITAEQQHPLGNPPRNLRDCAKPKTSPRIPAHGRGINAAILLPLGKSLIACSQPSCS